MDNSEMIDIEEHLQRSIGSEEVGMPTEKWVAVLEEMRQLRKENKALRERLAQPVHAIDMSEKHVHESDEYRHEWVEPPEFNEDYMPWKFKPPSKHASDMERNADYERGFIDGRQDQMKSSVDRAVNRMAPREWVGFTHEERGWLNEALNLGGRFAVIEAIEAKLKEKNT